MPYYPKPLERLINELRRLPGVGIKTAQRLAFHMMKMSPEEISALAKAIAELHSSLTYCSICGNITEIGRDPCDICSDPTRDHSLICVVEEPDDLLALERTGRYRGVYHVLMGALSPLEGITPEDLRIRELLERVNNEDIREVIIATNHTTEGQATAIYLANRLGKLDIKVTRIAYGIPVGGDLEYIDEVTLAKALEGRREMI